MSVHDFSERTCLRRYLFMAPQSHTLQLRGSSISTDLILGVNVSIHMQIACKTFHLTPLVSKLSLFSAPY